MGYSSSLTWQTDSKINKYNTWFILCIEALKYLDRPRGVSVDEIKYFFKKTRTHLSDSQISVALIKGLIADIFQTKNGRFFLNKYLKRIFFSETKEKFKVIKLKTRTLNKRKKRRRNKKYNRKRKWREQFEVDNLADTEINENQKMINYESSVFSDSLSQHVPSFGMLSNEDLEEGEIVTDSDETENTKDRMIAYPAFYNHINETKQIKFISSHKRKWLNDTNKRHIKKTRSDNNYQPHELDRMSEKYFELNVANKTDERVLSSWYKENYRKQISDNYVSVELEQGKNEFKEKQDYSLDVLSKMKNTDSSSRKRRCSDLKDVYQNEMDEDKDENIKPIRKVKILKEKLNNYRSSVTPANGSANGIKYPKSIVQKCLPISNNERMIFEEQKYPNNETIDEDLVTNRNLNDSDDCFKRKLADKKKKSRNRRRKKKVLKKIERMGKEFEKISTGQNVKNGIDNVSNKIVEKNEGKYKVGFALWRYFNPQRPYYEQPVKT